MKIFQKLIESEEISPSKIPLKLNDHSPEYIKNDFYSKINNFENVINSTFAFEDNKEKDIVLCISKIKDNCDFIENSFDSNFKKDFLTSEIPLNKDITKIDWENPPNNKYDEKENTKELVSNKLPINNKARQYVVILIVILLIFIIILLLKII